MPSAARVNDVHNCPLSNGGVPHLGGPINGPGVPTVLIEGRAAAVAGDRCSCSGASLNRIVRGSASVLVGGKPAARVGDPTAHGGVLVTGSPTVLIGG
jgi:uncharacterized Zn-binding protein involved in type VI secretion